MTYNPLLNDGCNVFYRPYRKKLSILDGGIIEYDVKVHRFDNFGQLEGGYKEGKRHYYAPCTFRNGPQAWEEDQKNPSYNYRFFCGEINEYPKEISFIHHGKGSLSCLDGYWVLTDSNGEYFPPSQQEQEDKVVTFKSREAYLQHYDECFFRPKEVRTDGANPYHPCDDPYSGPTSSGTCAPVMEVTGSRLYPSGYSNCEDPTESDLHKDPCTPNTIEYNHWIPNPSNLFDVGLGGLLGGKPGIGVGVSVSTGIFTGQKVWTAKHPDKDHCHELWRRKIDIRPGIGIGIRAGEGKFSIGAGASVGIEFYREKVGELCSDRGCPPPLVQSIECGRYQEPSGCCPDNLLACDIRGFICCYDPEDCELVKRCRI